MSEGATKRLAISVVRKLRSAGHEALLAGGCVRDMLLGHRPTDYDVATSATPKQVKKLFRRVLMVGAKFGVAMVIQQRRRIEVATFRTDLSYSDGRRPDAVKFVSAKEDALRRDFTINGIFYDPLDQRVVDYVDGQKDLQAGIIRAIGKADRRLSEDYLRMLRAVRFAGRLSFRIDPATARAIRRHARRISEISGERVREELEKMFAHRSAGRAVKELHDLGLLAAILPELPAKGASWQAALRRAGAVGRHRNALLMLSALLCELPRADLKKICRRWGTSNRTRDSLIWIADHLDDWPAMVDASLARIKRILAHPAADVLQTLWRVRERAETGKTVCTKAIGRRVARIDPEQVAPAPVVNGSDLKRLGVPEGEQLGRALAKLYEEQLNEQFPSRREALARARRIVGKNRRTRP